VRFFTFLPFPSSCGRVPKDRVVRDIERQQEMRERSREAIRKVMGKEKANHTAEPASPSRGGSS
jgi:hypothetical protein